LLTLTQLATPCWKRGERNHPFRITVSEEDLYALPSREEFTSHSNVLPPNMLGERLEGLLAQYVLMYALSVVARYKPHRWAGILQGETTLLPILEKLMAVAERWWPNLVLNKLTNTVVLFAPTMYWG
jgi:YaaC-like Protein